MSAWQLSRLQHHRSILLNQNSSLEHVQYSADAELLKVQVSTVAGAVAPCCSSNGTAQRPQHQQTTAVLCITVD